MGNILNGHWLTTSGDNRSFEPAVESNEFIELRHIFATVWRRKWLLFSTVLILTAPAVFYLQQSVPQYEARTRILLSGRTAEIVDFQAVLAGMSQDFATLRSEIEVLRSRELARKVINHLNLDSDPEFNPYLKPQDSGATEPSIGSGWLTGLTDFLAAFKRKPENAASSEPQSIERPRLTPEQRRAREQAATIDSFLKHLNVAPVAETRVIKLEFTSEKPETATQAVNTLADFYLFEQRQAKLDATQRATVWLNDRVASVREKVAASEREVKQFQQKAGLLGADKSISLLSQNLSELSTQLLRAAMAREEAESKLQQLNELATSPESIESAPEILSSELIQKLYLQELDLQRRRDELALEYGERHPRMIEVQVQVHAVQARIKAEIDKIIKSIELETSLARSRETSLQQELDDIKRQIARANEATVDMRVLELEAEANQTLLEALLARLKTTSSQNDIELHQADAVIISRADIPTQPLSIGKKAILMVAVVGSAGIGVLLIFLLEQMQPGFRDSDQVEQALRLPVLGLMPALKWYPKIWESPVSYLLRRPRSMLANAMYDLYTNLQLTQIDSQSNKASKKILIVSAVTKEGKTTAAVCLALTRMHAGHKVLLIDADMRKPNLHQVFKLPQSAGLVELLTGQASLQDVICNDPNSGVQIIQAGSGVRNPPDLLSSKAMDDLLSVLGQTYDLIIIDSPPIMSAVDGRILSRKVDLTIFVLRWASTEKRIASLALKRIGDAGAHLAGILLTQVDIKKHSHYGYGEVG